MILPAKMEDAVCNQEFAGAPPVGLEVPVEKVCDIVIVTFLDQSSTTGSIIHTACYNVKL